jgi:hypothetical protein
MKSFSRETKDQEAFTIDGRAHMFCLFEAKDDDGIVERWVQVMRAHPEPYNHMYNSVGRLVPGSDIELGDVTVHLDHFMSGDKAQVRFTAPDEVYIGFGRKGRRG